VGRFQLVKSQWGNVFLIIIISQVLLGCSSIQKMTINAAAEPFWNLGSHQQKRASWFQTKNSMPAQIEIVEGLLSQTPNNTDYLALAIKGNVAYSLLILETEYLREEWQKEWKPETFKNSEINYRENYHSLALYHYGMALKHAHAFFKERDLDYNHLLEKLNDEKHLKSMLDDHLKSTDMEIETLFFIGMSLALSINLNKKNLKLVAQLPLSKFFVDWACDKNPNLYDGSCDLFNGMYLVSRPKMLGGNPEMGENIFKNAMKKHPHNWLIHWFYVQFVLLPKGEQEEYLKVSELSKSWQTDWDACYFFVPTEKETDFCKENSLMRLFQSTALERFHLIKHFQDKLF